MADRTRRLVATSLVVGLLAAGLAVALGSTDRSAALLARGTTDWISVARTADGDPVANEAARQVATDDAVSDDGRFVVFDTTLELDDRDRERGEVELLALRAEPPSPSLDRDVYVHDRLLGTSTIVSIEWGSSDGSPFLDRFSDGSSNGAISGDGRFIAFLTATAGGSFEFDDRIDAVVVDRDPDGDGTYDEDPLADDDDGEGMPLVLRLPTVTGGGLGTPGYDPDANDLSDYDAMDVSISDDGSQVAVVTDDVAFSESTHSVATVVDRDVDRDGMFDELTESGAFRVSVVAIPDGDDAESVEISGDGRFVVFDATVLETAVDPEGELTEYEAPTVLVHDRDVGGDGAFDGDVRLDSIVVNLDPEDVLATGAPTISDDGRVVAYHREPDGNDFQVYVIDRGPPDLDGAYPIPPFTPRLVSTPDGTAPGDDDTRDPDLSGDGRYLAATTEADNLPGDCELDDGGPSDSSGELARCNDVLVWDLAQPALEPVVASVSPGGGTADDTSTTPSLSGTGRFIGFTSDARNLDPLQTGTPVSDTTSDDDTFVRELRPTLVGSPDPTDFGTVQTGVGASATRVVTFTNEAQAGADDDSWGPLTVTGLLVDGPFTVDSDTCTGVVLHRGDGCEVQVRYRPTVVGPETGTLRAVHEDRHWTEGRPVDPGEAPVDLVGVGGPPPRDPVFDAVPDPAEFPTTFIGEVADPQTVSVRNLGELPFTVGSVEVAGTDPDDFRIVSEDCTDAAITPPPDGCSVVVDFRPGAAGPRTAVLRFTDSAPGAVHLVDLTGTGEARVPVLTATPNPLDFGTVRTDASPPVGDITIGNAGNGPFDIDGLGIDGTDAARFTVAGTDCGGTLDPGGTCTVSIRFAPTGPGPRSAALVVDDTAPGRPHRVRLAGTGEVGTPRFAADPDPVDFGTALVGTPPADRVVTVTNTGDAPFTVTALGVAGPAAADFSIVTDTCLGGVVTPTIACTVTVRATPTAPGDRAAELRFTDTAPGSPHTVDLQVATAVPTLQFNPGLGPPGLVTTAVGTGWPANLPVTVTFPGHDGRFTGTAGPDGSCVLTGILILPRSQIGARIALGLSPTPSGAVASAFTTFLVVTPTVDGTPGFVFRK